MNVLQSASVDQLQGQRTEQAWSGSACSASVPLVRSSPGHVQYLGLDPVSGGLTAVIDLSAAFAQTGSAHTSETLRDRGLGGRGRDAATSR